MATATPEFRGTDRFVIERKIGQGGMGVVYQAFDRERRMDVALKTLLEVDAASIYRFKKEFRALADVSHPNLVSLYELFSDDDQWFFTMELITGSGLISYVCGIDESAENTIAPGERTDPEFGSPTVQTIRRETLATLNLKDGGARPPTGPLDEKFYEIPDVDFERLRDSMAQLAIGVSALHQSGHLHRDIKPSNVMVTTEGRVVLLDFGVVAELAGERRQLDEIEIVGTPAYMSPEQATGEGQSEASDWYAVGVILYQLLTGRRPFHGDSRSVIRQKRFGEPSAPSRFRDDIPEELNDLCRHLLRLRPHERPNDAEVLRSLGCEVPKSLSRAATHGGVDRDVHLVGRKSHLGVLRESLARTQRGYGTTLFVHGKSGMGKSALLRYFLDDVDSDDTAVVLEGRCYERESVPYKAVDSLVDSLSRYLLSLRTARIETLLPPSIGALAKVFPVLAQVELIAEAAQTTEDIPNRRELRNRAFAALRELLTRIARMQPLILFIDDLQWGDTDSALLLDALMKPPDAPPLLLLATYRTEDAARSPVLEALFAMETLVGYANRSQRLELGPLSEEASTELAQWLLPTHRGDDRAAAIANVSGGNPYLIHELAHYYSSQQATDATSAITLEAMIAGRVARLDPEAKKLIEIVALAGQPIRQGVAQQATGLTSKQRTAIFRLLRTELLIRLTGVTDKDFIDSYHDRIRETIAASLDADTLVAHHRALAEAIEQSDYPDPEMLASHLLAAGDVIEASRFVIEAASQAAEALAFERAAKLYQQVIDLNLDLSTEDRLGLEINLGDALLNAGRGADAAKRYTHAAEMASGSQALDLRRMAAEQFLRSGYLERGVETLRGVLEEVGLTLPKTPWRAIPRLLFRRAQLRLRGLSYTERSEQDLTERERMRLDICHAAATGLAVIDPARAAKFGTHATILALRAGEPFRLARALALEASFIACRGERVLKRVNQLSDLAEKVAYKLDDPRAIAYTLLMRGFTANQLGEFEKNYELCEKARNLLLTRCTGVTWEIHTADLCSLSSLLMRGRVNELGRLTRERLSDAEHCGDLYGITNLRTLYMPLVHLSEGNLERARQELKEGLDNWTGKTFDLQHMFALQVSLELDVYTGNGVEAFNRRRKNAGRVMRSMLLMVQLMRGNWLRVSANAALAAAVEDPKNRGKYLRAANRFARRLERERSPWLSAMGTLARSMVVASRGRTDKAVEMLRNALASFDKLGLDLFAAVARRRLGALLQGDEGNELVTAADKKLDELGYHSPIAAVWMLGPGTPFADERLNHKQLEA